MNDGMIGVKSIGVMVALMTRKYRPILCVIVHNILVRLCQEEVFPVITSAYRPQNQDSPHAWDRAIDFRTHGMDQELINKIEREVNEKWVYDPDRPEKQCAIYHDVGRGPHLHIQVHPNTIERI